MMDHRAPGTHSEDCLTCDVINYLPLACQAWLVDMYCTVPAGPDAVIPAPERPPHLHTMMAVGESGCGMNNAAVAAPSGDFCRATLVICPLVAVIQWRQEIARYTAPGTLKVSTPSCITSRT